jgi:5,10-methylenetetrahydromethanopterin reductase
LYDSPALYGDIWMIAALCAARTSRIGLGPGVLVPNLRHPLTQASAIATLEQLAPGRVAVAIGTGFTGRMAMGQKPLTWAYTRRYVEQLRALLRGEQVEVDGALVQMLHADEHAPKRPIATPIVIGANGPKGMAVARELGDGVMTVGSGEPTFDWCAALAFGTVLDDGEDSGSARVLSAAGPGSDGRVPRHVRRRSELGRRIAGRRRVAGSHRGSAGTARHLAVHEDHLVRVTDRDRPLLNGDLVKAFTWTGKRDEIRMRLDALEASGVSEILYAPMGPDVPRELDAFMIAASS